MGRLTMGLAALWLTSAAWAASGEGPAVTFHRDVEPILQQNCQSCHRPGEIAPMAFRTYEETRPWAQAIKEAVLLKRMPPWFADSTVDVHYKNDRSLSERQINVLAAWADQGAPQGDPADAPPPVEWTEGWALGEPDLVFELPKPFDVPAEGEVDYHYLVIPSGFEKDTWIQGVEIRPDNRTVLHHVIVYMRPQGSTWMEDAKVGEFYLPTEGKEAKKTDKRFWLSGYAPGLPPKLHEAGRAQMAPAGADFVLELHYTPTGKTQQDQSRFGLTLATEEPSYEVKTKYVADFEFAIPPGAPNHRVDAELEIKEDMTITSFLPHMHLRGKSFEYTAIYPDGREQVLLRVPRYDFNWQLYYDPVEPVLLPAGSKLHATAHYDNSPNNPANPDPTVEVKYGEQSWEEMMFGFFEVEVPVGQTASDD